MGAARAYASSATRSARARSSTSAPSTKRAGSSAGRVSSASGRGRDSSGGMAETEVVVRQGLEREQQGPGQQRRDDGERRVLGGGRNEDHPAVLHTGQQRILLGLREAVDLVEEEDG